MWLNRLEHKYGRYCIRGLTKYLVVGRIIMYLLITAFPAAFWTLFFAPLSRAAVMQGQVWQLLTFIITPPASSAFWFLVDAYFFYMIGSALEDVWGDFKFNVFILLSMAAAIISCVLTGVGTAGYLSTLMFIAYATYFPRQTMLVFFVLPVQAKYLGIAAGILLLLGFLTGGLATKVNILFACGALLLFFGKGLIQTITNEIRYAQNRRRWKNANRR